VRKIRLVASAVLASAVVVSAGVMPSGAQLASAGTPDTYVTDWDAIGSQEP
jgi:hypothetical protein